MCDIVKDGGSGGDEVVSDEKEQAPLVVQDLIEPGHYNMRMFTLILTSPLPSPPLSLSPSFLSQEILLDCSNRVTML